MERETERERAIEREAHETPPSYPDQLTRTQPAHTGARAFRTLNISRSPRAGRPTDRGDTVLPSLRYPFILFCGLTVQCEKKWLGKGKFESFFWKINQVLTREVSAVSFLYVSPSTSFRSVN